jgi:hypothetical protein
VFILLGIGAGIVIGRILGGSLDGLRALSFSLVPLALIGLALQLVLFSGPVADQVSEPVGRIVYATSTAAVFVALLANLRIVGVPVIALGAGLNLLAIVANGGVMPADPAAVASAGLVYDGGFSNSAIVPDPVLAPITDIFAVPASWPFANVFSIGDVLISIGLAWTIAAAMRRRPASPPDPPQVAHT